MAEVEEPRAEHNNIYWARIQVMHFTNAMVRIRNIQRYTVFFLHFHENNQGP